MRQGRDNLSDFVEDVDALVAGSMSEAELQRLVEGHLRDRGWLVYHAVTAIGSEPGLLDLVAVRPPRVLFLELKSSKGRLDRRVRYSRKGRRLPTQQEWFDALKRCPGIEVHLIRPSDWLDGSVEQLGE